MAARLVVQHARPLGIVHGYLDQAVAETYRRFEDRHPEPRSLSGHVVSPAVRDAVLCEAMSEPQMQAGVSSLSVQKGRSHSVRLVDGHGTSIRVRKFPMDRITGEPVREIKMPMPEPYLVEASGEELFGCPPPLDVELFVFWEPDLGVGQLKAASLAAAVDVDNSSLVQILALEPLPDPIRLTDGKPRVAPAPVAAQVEDDFEAEFESANGVQGL